MKITYIFHSSYLVELAHSILLFDYYQGDIPTLDSKKHLYVFVSHKHADHYHPAIWNLRNLHPHVTYVVHEDIVPSTNVDCVQVSCNQNLFIRDMQVETFTSTDEGCAFYITIEHTTIFHAGDLNWWHWEGEPDIDNQWHDIYFHREIEKLKGRTIDLAFIVLDPRQEMNAWWGFLAFMKACEMKHVFPMHFGKDVQGMHSYLSLPELAPFLNVIHAPDFTGQVFSIK